MGQAEDAPADFKNGRDEGGDTREVVLGLVEVVVGIWGIGEGERSAGQERERATLGTGEGVNKV